MLAQRGARGLSPPELAFYGGTFTALAPSALEACLDFAATLRRQGLIVSFRCSTRPDAVDAQVLRRLAEAGCACVELGVQSFSDCALKQAERGYTGSEARAACQLVQASGMELGVQLLPGMPGVTPKVFLEDVRAALALGARALRFYPCLVLAGTGLAALWRQGGFQPWTEEETLETLACGWLMARKAGAQVLRMGLAPGGELARAILAGPWHPALGSRVLGRALLAAVKAMLRGLVGIRPELARSPTELLLEAPAFAQGHIWGHRGELRTAWAALGLTPRHLLYQQEPLLRLSLL